MFKAECWIDDFFAGSRLSAEVSLHSYAFRQPGFNLSTDLFPLQRSFGVEVYSVASDSVVEPVVSDAPLAALLQNYQLSLNDRNALINLIKKFPSFSDPLLLLGLTYLLPAASNTQQRQQIFTRFASFLAFRFSQRPDLILQLIAAESALPVLKSLPDWLLLSSHYYSNTQCSLFHLQALWAKGRYQALHQAYVNYIFARRLFPLSDFMLRAFTIIGRIERTDLLFRHIYQRNNHELQLITISNMLFTALGLELIDHAYVAKLVADYHRLSPSTAPAFISSASTSPRQLSVYEKPLLAVISADLRLHPVGRFWLPIARQLQKQFKLVHLAFNPLDQDEIRSELISLSHRWQPLEANDDISPLMDELQPQLLLDLGGHTADNRPGLLNQRYAPVQATYLGFFGPSYGLHCDWWILDSPIARRVQNSYPGSESIWALPGPSLCFDPSAHGLPAVDQLRYSEPDHPCLGSFNHTRKLTDSCIERFASVLTHLDTATLLFRSHSFYDSAVRRWFLQRFLDAGVNPAQLQPIPYAATGVDSLLDYGRIHLHLDSYPVCGTTTTLDSMAMGIPVLTCPNHLYAGAISAAIIEQAGFADWICNNPADLPAMARTLSARYRSASARKSLAQQVRLSPVCDTQGMPKMFAAQLKEMLKVAFN